MADSTAPEWIPAAHAFTPDDMVVFHDRGRRSLDDALATVDLIVTGPHASAAFPEEMKPFVDGRLTRRLQFDFTDVSTSPIARRWAEIDPRTLYVENPHPRAVRDANRARPDDLGRDLRAAFERLKAAGEGGRPSLTGVDAVRPVTFGYLPVLTEPRSDGEWDDLVEALLRGGALGVDRYEALRDDLVGRAVAAKLARLATLDPAELTASEWRSATTLLVLSIHDTMNHTARPDGAIRLERKPADRLPQVMALSNRGGPDAAVRPSADGTLIDEIDVLSLDAPTTRAIAQCYRWAFDAWGDDDVAFNRPYFGGYETSEAGPRLRGLAERAVTTSAAGTPVRLHLGAWQNEFLREFLLGPEASAALMEPGGEWVTVPEDRVDWLAERLKAAHDRYRAWGAAVL